jgi:hypothetical protein
VAWDFHFDEEEEEGAPEEGAEARAVQKMTKARAGLKKHARVRGVASPCVR